MRHSITMSWYNFYELFRCFVFNELRLRHDLTKIIDFFKESCGLRTWIQFSIMRRSSRGIKSERGKLRLLRIDDSWLDIVLRMWRPGWCTGKSSIKMTYNSRVSKPATMSKIAASRVKIVGRTWIAGFSPNECWVRENFVLYRAVPYEKVWASARETRTHVSGLSRSRFRSSFYTKRKEPTRTFFETPPSVAVSTYFAFIVSKTCHPHATSEIPPSIWTEIEVWLNDPFHSTAFDETALLCDPRDCLNISKLIKLAE